MKWHDIFEANSIFENGNKMQVQIMLVALEGLAKTKGFYITISIGVKYAEKWTRRFDEGKWKAGQSIIGLPMGTNKCASQASMTAYGTRRHFYDPQMQTDKSFDQITIRLHMGTNKGASWAEMDSARYQKRHPPSEGNLTTSGQLGNFSTAGYQQSCFPERNECMGLGSK